MKKNSQFASTSFLTSILLPFILGMVLYGMVMTMINGQVIKNELLVRYLTGHPVSLFTTAMFCVGIASLILVGKNVLDQNLLRRKISLPKIENPPRGLDGDIRKAKICADHLLLMPKRFREFYLWNRLHAALEAIRRNRAADQVEEELKYLSDLDQERQAERFGLVRILIWATPMLGFLGTVLGISQALGSINVGADNDFQQMLAGLRESLYVAFDTTALALTFSILMMFGQFVVDRFDGQLLMAVDQQSRSELEPIFDLAAGSRDPDTKLFQDISKQITGSVEQATSSQVEIWSESMIQAQEQWHASAQELHQQWKDTQQQIVQDNQWTTMHENWEQIQHKWAAIHQDLFQKWDSYQQQQQQSWNESANLIKQKLADVLEASGQRFETGLGEQLNRADEQMERRWQQLQVSISDSARRVQDQQNEMRAQTEAMIGAMRGIESMIESDSENLPDRNPMIVAMDALGQQLGEMNQRLLTVIEREDPNQSVVAAIERMAESFDAERDSRRDTIPPQEFESAQQMKRLGEVIESLREEIADSRRDPEEHRPNQELKLRIIRPAA